ncbi:MAG: formimidoylglutamase [Flavipsychrobacter sp.]
MQDLSSFFSDKHFIESQGNIYGPSQLGAYISCLTHDDFHVEDADIVIVGCGEQRGKGRKLGYSNAPDAIRAELYQLHFWHSNVKIVDMGNVLEGATVNDTKAALRTVLHELQQEGKTVVVLGGSHDLTLEQYEAFKKSQKMINATVSDMLIDLEETEGVTDRSFLMDMLTEQPNFVKHYNHIAFQSYYVEPKILETLDKLRFDFYRLGVVKDNVEHMEPVLRSSDIFSFDINTVKYCDAPTNDNASPNGLAGDESCQLARYAGMSDKLTSFGIYGYAPEKDIHKMTAKLISQMLWYFIDGYHVRQTEAPFVDKDEYLSFYLSFSEIDAEFLKSKRTNRWWMKLPSGDYVPCTYEDYQTASNGNIPERWFREQERLV